jgi:simple sugar transport system permease protein
MQATLRPNALNRGGNKSFLRFLLDWAAIITLALCFVIFTLLKGTSFMSENNMINILRAMSITTVFGIAATVTMAPDGFDMSACTLASCSAYVFVSAYLWYGLPLWLCVVVTVVVTLVMYQLTMFLILVCKIPDMLATCALMFVHQGLGQWYIGGGAVSTGMRLPSGAAPARTALSDSFSAIGRAPWIIVIMLACVLAAYIFLEFTKHGRFIYAMGGNKQAAKLSGINVKGYRYLAGMITAVFIAIGGILVSSRGSSAQVMCCDNYLMQSLAAVFVGRSVGGAEKPNALGTLVGAMLVSTLENGLTIMAVSYYVLPAVKGAVLALALIAAYASKREQ